MGVPQSTADTKCTTATSPVCRSTSTSANWAMKGGGDSCTMWEAVAWIWNWFRWYRLYRATSS